MRKWWVIIIILLGIQLIRPAKNQSALVSNSIVNQYNVPDSTAKLLVKACNDCHSNTTVYPWYAEIQPLGWWLNNHIKHGKKALNFDEFTTYAKEDHEHIFDEIIETVTEEKMPLKSYTWLGLHKEAKLTEAERLNIINWAKENKHKVKR